MTLQNIIEFIQDEYPKYGESYLKIKVNNVYKSFCHKTQILKKTIGISSTDPAWLFIDNVACLDLVAKGVDRVKKIIFVSSSDDLIEEPCKWQILGDELQLLYTSPLSSVINEQNDQFVDNDGNSISTELNNLIVFSGTFKVLSMEIVAIPGRLVELTDSIELSDDFAEAIIYGVKENLAFGNKDYPGASYCKSKYKELVIEGLKEGNEGKDGTPLTPEMHFQ
jgi:hypothetical protein